MDDIFGFRVTEFDGYRLLGQVMPVNVGAAASGAHARSMLLETAEGVVRTILAQGWALSNDGWNVTFRVPWNDFRRTEGMVECELEMNLVASSRFESPPARLAGTSTALTITPTSPA